MVFRTVSNPSAGASGKPVAVEKPIQDVFPTFHPIRQDLQDWFYTAESHNFGTKVGKISGKTSYNKGFNFRPIQKYAKHAARAVRMRRFLDRGRRRRRGGLGIVRENPFDVILSDTGCKGPRWASRSSCCRRRQSTRRSRPCATAPGIPPKPIDMTGCCSPSTAPSTIPRPRRCPPRSSPGTPHPPRAQCAGGAYHRHLAPDQACPTC